MDHVAAPWHTVEGAGAQFLVQPRGMLVGVDDAIIGSGNEAHWNAQVPVETGDHLGSVKQHRRFFIDRLHLRQPHCKWHRKGSLEPPGNCETRFGFLPHVLAGRKPGAFSRPATRMP